MDRFRIPYAFLLLISLSMASCGSPWNNPYPQADAFKNNLYLSFSERPKHLDPARSYSSNEYTFIGQIYEPPLQYHYLKRPYQLVPLAAREIPGTEFYDKNNVRLPVDANPALVAYSIYTIQIKPGIMYQPHPAFATDAAGNHRYHQLSPEDIAQVFQLSDFAETGTRELDAADYVYQIKRIAHPANHSPILGLMSDYIVGLSEYSTTLSKAYDEAKARGGVFLDLRNYDFDGVKVVDRYTYQIKVKGTYPQLLYWLAMPFFAPMPVEAEQFYLQKGMAERNITLDWYPVGSGAYYLTVNNPNRQMILARNPHYRGEPYPTDGDPEDAAAGLLADAGKPTPFIDNIVFNLETETIPYWNKFLQGYYDTSGIDSESFDQAIRIGTGGEVGLTESMAEKGIRLSTSVAASSMYFGFNMRDSTVGGYSEAARKLRQAISIVMNFEEYISIFANGRGISAQSPIPPGIFGYQDGEAGIDPYVYDWEQGKAQRKSIEYAKKLLAEAGYPGGVEQQTGKPLVVNLDITASGPDDAARLNWYRKQFQKLNIQLVIRNTLYNQFQEKMLKGTAQIFIWGWNADYPDPENFLFLLYGPNSKVDVNGENAANYANPEFDRLFDQMKNMPNGEARRQIIDKMISIVQRDAPWMFGFHPKNFGLYHSWFLNAKPNLMSHNTMQYKRIDTAQRVQKQQEWNQPILWPIGLITVLLIIGTVPAVITYKRREKMAPSRIKE